MALDIAELAYIMVNAEMRLWGYAGGTVIWTFWAVLTRN